MEALARWRLGPLSGQCEHPFGFFLLRLFLDRPPPRGRDHDLANLDRRVAGHDTRRPTVASPGRTKPASVRRLKPWP